MRADELRTSIATSTYPPLSTFVPAWTAASSPDLVNEDEQVRSLTSVGAEKAVASH